MNVNAGIVDQQVLGLSRRLTSEIAARIGCSESDEPKIRSAGFLLLCVKTMLDLDDDDGLECLTEGGSDFAVDGLEISDVSESEFVVTLLQAKYSRQLDGSSNFPETDVTKTIQAVRLLFDPAVPLVLNPRLRVRVEEVRSLIQQGHLPQVRYLLCNNGLRWNDSAQQLIDAGRFGDQVRFEHVNHDTLIGVQQRVRPVDDTLRFHGRVLSEDFNYSRVLVGKMAITDVARLLEAHGDRLLERNIRRFLGLNGNRVNEAIRATLREPTQGANFYFFNNGITLTCARFDYSGLQAENHHVPVKALQIINGGQTCKTIETTLREMIRDRLPFEHLERAHVLVRLYQLPADSDDLARSITYATNSQNPVDLRDLRSNDYRQRKLELALGDLGYSYRRKRMESPSKAEDITTATAAEAVLAVWRSLPQLAKFKSREHFGKLYDTIFSDTLNGAQLVCAVLLFRIAENKRKRPTPGTPDSLAYGSYFLAMVMGRYLLRDLGVELAQLDHRNFDVAKKKIESQGEAYFAAAMKEIETALGRLYGGQAVTLQRLSATFRRGDLITELAHPYSAASAGKAPAP